MNVLINLVGLFSSILDSLETVLNENCVDYDTCSEEVSKLIRIIGLICIMSLPGTQEEAAEAYDIAAIKFRGTSAVTNFDISRYDVKRICSSNTLIASDLAKRPSPNKDSPPALQLEEPLAITDGHDNDGSNDLTASLMWTSQTDDHNRPQECNSSPVYLSPESHKYEECAISNGENNEVADDVGLSKHNHLGVVNQVPIFALWNE